MQYVHTGPLTHPIIREPAREREEREDAAAETLGYISLVCAVVAIFVWALIFGFIALACGIPSYLRGSQRGLYGIIIALLAIGGWLLMLIL